MEIVKIEVNRNKNKFDYVLVLETLYDFNQYVNTINYLLPNSIAEQWSLAKKSVDSNGLFDRNVFTHSVSSKQAYKYALANMFFSSVGVTDFNTNIDTTLMDFVQFNHKHLDSKLSNIRDYILDGRKVRINKKGGYCPFDISDNTIIEKFTCTKIQMSNFIQQRDFFVKDVIIIDKEILIIENSEYFTDWVKLKYINKDNVFELNNFSERIHNYDKDDLYKMFNTAINNGLNKIAFSTSSLSNVNNFSIMKDIIIDIMNNNPDKELIIEMESLDKNYPTINCKNIILKF